VTGTPQEVAQFPHPFITTFFQGERGRQALLRRLGCGHLRFRCEIDAGLPPVFVHGDRFRQLWHLLFIEEITHLKSGEAFEVRAGVEDDPLENRRQLVITLLDNGGWEAKDRAVNLFDPFFTRSRRSDDFGINMMTCFVTVHLHGGTIEARRLEPRGLELIMRLPVDPANAMPEAEGFARGAETGDPDLGLNAASA
jgi:signal transduction histidine kinase